MTTEMLPVASLVEDLDFYPRVQIDSTHVGYIAEAIKSGQKMPPIVVDRKTKIIIDGLHRHRAIKRLTKGEGLIEAELRDYEDRKNMLLDAIALNAQHGKALSTCDREHCAILAEQIGLSGMRLRTVLHMTIKTYERIKQRIVIERSTGEKVATKRTFEPVIISRGLKTFTDRQIETNARSSGMTQVFYVNQVIDIIEANLLDEKNVTLMENLAKLRDLLNGYFKAKKAS